METQTFKEYVLNWWNEFVENHESEAKRLMEYFIGEEEYVEDYLEGSQTPKEWLEALDDPKEIYEVFFGFNACDAYFEDLQDTQHFLMDMFKNACYELDYDFAEEFIENMAYKASGYDSPDGFFEDLQRGGCVSGMVSMLIYNSDCKKIYVDHIDSMEDYIAEMEEECGCRLSNKDNLPHYTFVCWACYEELSYNIGRELFPEKF